MSNGSGEALQTLVMLLKYQFVGSAYQTFAKSKDTNELRYIKGIVESVGVKEIDANTLQIEIKLTDGKTHYKLAIPIKLEYEGYIVYAEMPVFEIVQ